jgi:hypothetical protein
MHTAYRLGAPPRGLGNAAHPARRNAKIDMRWILRRKLGISGKRRHDERAFRPERLDYSVDDRIRRALDAPEAAQ